MDPSQRRVDVVSLPEPLLTAQISRRARRTVQPADMGSLTRRELLRLGLVAGLAGVATSCGRDEPDLVVPPNPPTTAGVQPGGAANWPGHQPGQIYVGVSGGGDLEATLRVTGPVGAHRSYYQWSGLERELATIRRDHAEHRLPWTSFKPPSATPGGWAAVASGAHDADLRARARGYEGLSGPVVATFHHEPHNDAGQGEDFAAAWVRTYDVMRDETGLRNVALVPVLGEWVWNERNPAGRPEDYLSHDLLGRCAFLGVDLYQNRSSEGYAERLGPILAWLDSRGFSRLMLGVGESGCTDDFGNPTGAQWWERCWAWAERNAARVGAIAYFNSARNNRSGNDWLLSQSPEKLAAFRATLASSRSCLLP